MNPGRANPNPKLEIAYPATTIAAMNHGPHAAALLRTKPRELLRRLQTRREADELLRRPVAVGQRDDVALRLAIGQQQQTLALDTAEHVPRDGERGQAILGLPAVGKDAIQPTLHATEFFIEQRRRGIGRTGLDHARLEVAEIQELLGQKNTAR